LTLKHIDALGFEGQLPQLFGGLHTRQVNKERVQTQPGKKAQVVCFSALFVVDPEGNYLT